MSSMRAAGMARMCDLPLMGLVKSTRNSSPDRVSSSHQARSRVVMRLRPYSQNSSMKRCSGAYLLSMVMPSPMT